MAVASMRAQHEFYGVPPADDVPWLTACDGKPWGEYRDDLREFGATIIPGVLTPHMVARCRAAVDEQVRMQGIEVKSVVAETLPFSLENPVYRDLVWWPQTHVVLDRIGVSDLRWMGGAVIPKPAGEPRRSWHQDWWGWNDTAARWDDPPQVGLLYYLHKTDEDNGALTILPGSHRKRKPLHDTFMTVARAAMSEDPQEQPLPAFPGDVVVLDARCLHASRFMSAETVERRDLITVWYVAGFGRHTPELQARCHRLSGQGTEGLLGPLCPADSGAEPIPQDYQVQL